MSNSCSKLGFSEIAQNSPKSALNHESFGDFSKKIVQIEGQKSRTLVQNRIFATF